MAQNTSSAVMQQRSEPHNSLDDFPTPPWATRALCEWLMLKAMPIDHMTCREPAANRGHMVKPLSEYFDLVEASDVHDYGAGYPIKDYLFGDLPQSVDFTITNPPFKLAEQFIDRACQSSTVGFAVIVRAAFLESIGRYNTLFSTNPPSHVLQFSERVVMHKGKLSEKGSTATAYAWLVWIKGQDGTQLEWIAPCRKLFERASDYPAQAIDAQSDATGTGAAVGESALRQDAT